ncbi:NAD(P)-binding protein [Amniculicola lignicola CBS 123094]|uniref:NAD(P)-binding protein n=1 Tax=Amniculicola lignicola CBS 123094 TaxID=1392246 RepID=A0A6A5WIP2_9PLEO|nr:NAD(P)-binding protein [Amniculicola lignicola CBS 123094]
MPSKRVLLTGANNLVGSHVLDQLLSFNVPVRAVVGSNEEAHYLAQQYSTTKTSLLDIAIVPLKDAAKPGAYDGALSRYPEPFDAVIHTFNPELFDEADCLTRIINLETDALFNFLRSVKHAAAYVRRVIIITSLTPFARWLADPTQRTTPLAPDYVLAATRASDNIVWDALSRWQRDFSAPFDLVAVTAPSVYGPSIRPLGNSSDLQEANRRIWNICSNDYTESCTSPPYGIDHYTDVRDLAIAGVRAVFTPAAGNKRFVISTGAMPSGSVIAEFLASRFPELASRVTATNSPPRPQSTDPPDIMETHLNSSILGLTRYRPLEETLRDVAQQIIELQRRKDWRSVIQS